MAVTSSTRKPAPPSPSGSSNPRIPSRAKSPPDGTSAIRISPRPPAGQVNVRLPSPVVNSRTAIQVPYVNCSAGRRNCNGEPLPSETWHRGRGRPSRTNRPRSAFAGRVTWWVPEAGKTASACAMSRTNRATASPNRTAAMTTSTVPTANHAGLGRFFVGGTVVGYGEGYSECGWYGTLTQSTLPDFFGGRGFWQNRALSLLRPVPLNRA